MKLYKNVSLASLGCSKNLVDAEQMLGLLTSAGYNIVENEEDADVIIVNTCTFIEAAKNESIECILELADYKNKNCKALIVTGCLAQRYREQILSEMPEVDAVDDQPVELGHQQLDVIHHQQRQDAQQQCGRVAQVIAVDVLAEDHCFSLLFPEHRGEPMPAGRTPAGGQPASVCCTTAPVYGPGHRVVNICCRKC